MKQESDKTILYLSKHFQKKISLKELAKEAGMSPFHFHRKFVAENNCTPQMYLERIRMDHASHLMTLFPNYALTDVAFESGYSSPGIFSRAFKKYYGIPPSQYERESVKKELKTTNDKSNDIKIQYRQKKSIAVKKVKLVEKELNFAVQGLIEKASKNITVFGFFLDSPFHVALEDCRFFIGATSSKVDQNSTILSIPSGYYTSITMTGGFDLIEEKLVLINSQIQAKGYVIDSLIGYEKILVKKESQPFEYMKSTREILIKIAKV